MKNETSAILALVSLVLLANGILGTALPIRMSDIGVPAAQIAELGAFAFGGALVGAPIAAAVLRKFGNRGTFPAFATLYGLWIVSLTLNRNATALQVERMAAGIFFSALTVVVETRLNTLAPAGRRSRLLAFYMMAYYGSQATGSALTGLDKGGASAALAAAGLLLFLASGVSVIIRAPGHQPSEGGATLSIDQLRRAPDGYLFGFMTGSMLGCFYGFGPVYALHTLANPRLAGSFMAAAMVGGVLGLTLSGRLADRFGIAPVSAAWASLLAGAGAVIAALPQSSDLVILSAGAAFGAVLFPMYPFGSALVNARLFACDRATGNALYIIAIGIGGIFGPFAGAVLARLMAGVNAGFAVISLSAFVAAFIVVSRYLLERRLARESAPLLACRE